MTIDLRAEREPPSATLLIHMGAGAKQSVIAAAIRNYGDYRQLTRDGFGIYAVSVFAVASGVSEAQIVSALPQRSFARATVGEVFGAGFQILATSIRDPDLDPAIVAIQHVHYDIVLPTLDDDRLRAIDPLDDEDLEALAYAHLAPHVQGVLAVFGPRHQK